MMLLWEWPSRVFQQLHIDFARPFQGAMFFDVVDAYSRWPFVSVMQSTSVEKTIEELHRLVSSYVILEQIVSDNEPQFTPKPFAVFMNMNRIHHTHSVPHHPPTNGLAEWFVQSLKYGLKASLSSGLSLSRHLTNFLLMYRSATVVTPSSLFLKQELRTQFDLLRSDHEKEISRKQKCNRKTITINTLLHNDLQLVIHLQSNTYSIIYPFFQINWQQHLQSNSHSKTYPSHH